MQQDRQFEGQAASSSDGWWQFGDSMSPSDPQPPLAGFRASSLRLGPSCIQDFEFGVPPDSQYCFPPQADTKTGLIPFSPSFSPLQLDSDAHLRLNGGATSDGSAYWMGHSDGWEFADDALLQSPQWSDVPSCPPDLWNAIMLSSSFGVPDVVSPNPSYRFPSSSSFPHIAPRPTSPSSDSSGRLSPISVFTSSAASSRRSSIDTDASGPSLKRCSHCSATVTPLWRRNPATRLPLCNACGLYLQQRHKLRPLALIAADQEDDEADESDEHGADAGGPECSHCHTRKTSVWRRSKTGAKLCNACGVYARLRGRDRPLSLKRNKIKPRCKHAK
ncbi:Gata zinc finger domain-containing protein [Mycena venus]|uniref:Gata zinc finger domain-containing protein n=1 Tax=Mycena venus TaxID=2733690 RepID=A0A8H6Y8M7_9AGAR|nr:Gata zinc finger domain-containing protein [Mycena venus]